MEVRSNIRQLAILSIILLAAIIVICACRNSEGKMDAVSFPALYSSQHALMTLTPDFTIETIDSTLNQQNMRLRTGRELPFVGVLSVDGKLYRFMGGDSLRILPLVTLAERNSGWKCKFSYLYPGISWEQPEYNDSSWLEGEGALGMENCPYPVHSIWGSDKLYVRRHAILNNIDSVRKHNLYLRYVCDDEMELYFNGKFVFKENRYTPNPACIQLSDEAISQLHNGDNVIAVYVRNIAGGALVDFGLYAENKGDNKIEIATLKMMNVQATQTQYTFQCGEVELLLDFVSPALLDNPDVSGCPVGFITYRVNAKDNKRHDVRIQFDMDTKWMFGKDDVKSNIEQDWRFVQADSVYLAVNAGETVYSCEDGHVIISQQMHKDDDCGVLLLGYADQRNLQYEGEILLPYWNKDEKRDVKDALKSIGRRARKIKEECDKEDAKWMPKAFRVGGSNYAEQVIPSYRTFLSTHRLVMAADKQKVFCFGDTLGNVREAFHSFPTLLFFDRIDWMKALLNPIFEYSENEYWTKNYPPYDIGISPIVNRQAGIDACSIEVAADMLIMVSAIVEAEKDFSYANLHWNVLCKWAEHLKVGHGDREKRTLGWVAYQKLVRWKEEI